MDRKAIIAVSLAIITMIVWQIKFAPKYAPPQKSELPPQPAAEASATPGVGPSNAVITSAAPSPAVTGTMPANAAPEPPVAESIEKAASPSVEYSFTNLGGGISRAVMLKHTAEEGNNVTLNEFDAVPIGAISERPEQTTMLPFKVTTNPQSGEVLCDYTEANGVQIVKKFTLPKATGGAEEYLVRLDVSWTNRGAQPFQSSGYYISLGSAAPVHRRDLPTYTRFDWSHGGSADKIDVSWFDASHLLGIQTRAPRPIFDRPVNDVVWAGVQSQYFTTILTTGDKQPGRAVWARRLLTRKDEPGAPWAIEGAVQLPGFSLAPGQSATQQLTIYIGPKEYARLKQLGRGQEEAMHFGTFKIVSEFLLSSMNKLHSLTGSYAAAIIVLTLCIRGIMWPLQNKATQSMKQMQALQPRLTELREKYKDDPTRFNQETMKLYRDYGVNPFSGCWPMFIQIPIFFGFYAMLGSAFELRGSRFLWVHDLSQPDTVFHIAGYPVNILPLCMAATMLIQMHLTPKSGDATQQKVFMFVPLIFIVFCYNFASALALYWTVQNLFSIVQLYLTRNRTAPALQKIAPPRRKKR